MRMVEIFLQIGHRFVGGTVHEHEPGQHREPRCIRRKVLRSFFPIVVTGKYCPDGPQDLLKAFPSRALRFLLWWAGTAEILSGPWSHGREGWRPESAAWDQGFFFCGDKAGPRSASRDVTRTIVFEAFGVAQKAIKFLLQKICAFSGFVVLLFPMLRQRCCVLECQQIHSVPMGMIIH